MKSLLLAAVLAFGVSASPPRDTYPNTSLVNHSLVPRFECSNERGAVVGSGVRLAPEIVITATHVTGGRTCTANGEPAIVTHEGKGLDFSAVKIPDDGNPLYTVVSCDGIREGQVYFAAGYAEAGPLRVVRLIGSNKRFRQPGFEGLTIFSGVVHGGMSGGPIVDIDGRVVAIVNAGNPSAKYTLGRSLLDTYLCGPGR